MRYSQSPSSSLVLYFDWNVWSLTSQSSHIQTNMTWEPIIDKIDFSSIV